MLEKNTYLMHLIVNSVQFRFRDNFWQLSQTDGYLILKLSRGNIPIAEIIGQLSKGQILTTFLFLPLSKAKILNLECCRFGKIP